MGTTERVARIVVYVTPIVAAVAIAGGILVFMSVPGTSRAGQIAMATWGVGLLLVVQGLTTLIVVVELFLEWNITIGS